MPAFKGKLEQEKIDALVHLIRREFHGQNTTGTSSPTTPAR
jgi:hypothetical protein